MRIQIDPEWLVDCDETCCQLIRLVTITGNNARGKQPKPENIGKIREEGNGFYGSLEQAIQGYLKKRLQGSECSTAEQILAHLRQSEQAVRELVAQLQMSRKDLARVEP